MAYDHFAHSMPFGAMLLPEGGVRFRLWAPGQPALSVVLENSAQEPFEMRPVGDGWFECDVAEARAGTQYRFVLADGMRVPDPASRYQPHDVHGPSEVVDPLAYPWQTGDWIGRRWEEAVIYEVHTGCFSPAGDFDGIRAKLDHLVSLGVTALELMPIADFEGRRNWGYDGVLPFAPDSAYGTPDDLKRLIDEAHARGVMVLLDVVYNHFGPSGNYLHLYAPDFFTDRHRTPWGAAINFDGSSSHWVREFFVQNALFWIGEYRFDGLRFDAVHAIRDDSSPNILAEIAVRVRAHVDPGRHIHLTLENDSNRASLLDRDGGGRPPLYNAQWNDDFHHAAHVVATGETQGYYCDYATEPAAKLARALAEGFAYQGEASFHRDGALRGEASTQLPPAAFVNFLQNHDQIGNRAFGERLQVLADERAIDVLTTLVLLSPSVPMLFMGEEWGTLQPFRFFCDFHGDLANAVREGRRREFSRFPEFAEPADRNRIPDPNQYSTFEGSRLDWTELEKHRHRLRLDRCRALLEIRRQDITPRLFKMTGAAGDYDVRIDRVIRASWRLGDGSRLQLSANLSARPAAGLDWPLEGRCICASPQGLKTSSLIASFPAWTALWHLS